MSNSPLTQVITTGISDTDTVTAINTIKAQIATNVNKQNGYEAAEVLAALCSKLRQLGV